jgi:hypothetical protein
MTAPAFRRWLLFFGKAVVGRHSLPPLLFVFMLYGCAVRAAITEPRARSHLSQPCSRWPLAHRIKFGPSSFG